MSAFSFGKKSENLFQCLGCVVLMMLSSCSRPLPADEGRKHLRAFDNEALQIVNRAAKTDAIKALFTLLKLDEAPLPFLGEVSDTAYDFNDHKGLYHVNAFGEIQKFASGDSVMLIFPFESKIDSQAVFVLSDYSETQTALNMIFPQKMEAKIMSGNYTLLTLHYNARFEHDFPAEMNMELLFADFKVMMQMHTTFGRSNSTVNLDFEVIEGTKQFLKSKIISEVQLVNNSLVYNKKEIELAVYPIKMVYRSDQDFSNQDASSFISNFNQHTEITILSSNGDEIGEVFLAAIPGRDRINPMIRYSDGTPESLEDLMLVLRRLLNMKIVILN